ncbi:MAG: lysophospholipid acyltransferase family protein [bacterium]
MHKENETSALCGAREKAPELYWKMYELFAPAILRLHRVDIVNENNLTPTGEGGLIIAAIHNGALDGAFIALAAGRRGRAVRFIGDEELCNTPFLGKLVRGAGVISIASHRGKGAKPEQVRIALAEAAEVIQAGGTIGIFPEGIIRPFFSTRKSFPFKTGVIRLAVATGAAIVPAWAQGAGAVFPWISPFKVKGKTFYGAIPVWTPSHIRVHFGKPFKVDKSLTLESPVDAFIKESERLMRAADALRNS